jgi:hypothetical protein
MAKKIAVKTEKTIKYRVFKIPKRSGGFRKIEEPLGDGMEILTKKLKKFEKMTELKPSYFCHSFMRGRNIVTCARQHFGNKVLVRMDISDFFPSVTWEKYKEIVLDKRHIFDMKSSEKAKAKKIHDDIKICFKYDRKRKVHYLPQGAPTSPLLSNAYLRRFDWECAWFCYRNKVIYNRYADDIYLSAKKSDKALWSSVFCVHNKLKNIGLDENKKKRKVMYPGKRMNVVGIVINEKFNIPKKTRKIIRAIKHNAKKDKKEYTAEQKGLMAFQDMVKKYKKKIKNNLVICKEYELLDKI